MKADVCSAWPIGALCLGRESAATVLHAIRAPTRGRDVAGAPSGEHPAASFPAEGGAERLRELFAADIGKNGLGVDARREGSEIHFTYPVLVLLSRKPKA